MIRNILYCRIINNKKHKSTRDFKPSHLGYCTGLGRVYSVFIVLTMTCRYIGFKLFIHLKNSVAIYRNL